MTPPKPPPSEGDLQPAASQPSSPSLQASKDIPTSTTALLTDAWKLKTNFGLIYDFPDTNSLQSWLMGRESLEGYLLSRDGTDFRELDGFPDVINPALRAKITAAAVGLAPPNTSSAAKDIAPAISPAVEAKSSLGAAPPTASSAPLPSQLQRKAAPPPNVPKLRPPPPQKTASKWLSIVGVVVLLFLALAALQFTGVVNFRALVSSDEAAPVARTTDGVETSTNNTTTAAQNTNTNAKPTESPQLPPPRANKANPFTNTEHVRGLLEQAQKDMRSQKYDEAIATLNSAKGIAPRNPEIYKLLERAYSRAGRHDEAREVRKLARELKRESP